MKISYKLVLFLSVMLSLTACTKQKTSSSRDGVLPVVLTHSNTQDLLIAPSLIDNYVLDERDKVLISEVTRKVLEFTFSGQSLEWKNVDSRHHGSVMATKVYEDKLGRYCREFSQSIITVKKIHKVYANACRTQIGEWELSI